MAAGLGNRRALPIVLVERLIVDLIRQRLTKGGIAMQTRIAKTVIAVGYFVERVIEVRLPVAALYGLDLIDRSGWSPGEWRTYGADGRRWRE